MTKKVVIFLKKNRVTLNSVAAPGDTNSSDATEIKIGVNT